MPPTTTQPAPQMTPQPSSNLVLVGVVSVAVGLAAAAIGYYAGQPSGAGKTIVAQDVGDDERPPIIVGNGGSVTIEAQIHPKGGRGQIQNSSGTYKHVDANPKHKPPKGLDLTVYGASGDTTCADMSYKKATGLVVSYGKDDVEANWLKITFGPLDVNGSDLTWTLDAKETTAKLNNRYDLLELQGGMSPEWFLKRATFTAAGVLHTCNFTDKTGDQAILIEQKK